MVLKILGAAARVLLPSKNLVYFVVSILLLVVIRAFAQGRSTTRERDLHARVILVTDGFTPLGLTLLQSLAERGAHIIALTSSTIDSPNIEVLVDLLRSSTKNENIFAEQCDLASPKSIHSFCTRFLTGQDQRLDALVFNHEYRHMGPILSPRKVAQLEEERQAASLATFLMITLLLPALLVAPAERDIRIINVVNPFYAAAAPFFDPTFSAAKSTSSVFQLEGNRSLRIAVLTRHLQRVLDALPSAQVPKTDEGTSTIQVVNQKAQRSNIVAVSVSPGISRTDTIAPALHADTSGASTHSSTGVALYFILQPILRILTKSPPAALQSVLHVLFLPTPFKIRSKSKPKTSASQTALDSTPEEELLKPGALYSDCAVVRLQIPPPIMPSLEKVTESKLEKPVEDDGELGGELAGRLVWEAFEERLKVWEKSFGSDESKDTEEINTSSSSASTK